MKAPSLVPPFSLIERDGGDVSVHLTLEDAERSIESPDVDTLVVFDSQGYALVPRARRWNSVVLEWDGQSPRPRVLQRLLNDFLRSVERPSDDSGSGLASIVDALAAIKRWQEE